MGKKAGKQASERPKTTSTLSQPAPATAAAADCLTRFSPSGRLFAQCSIAVDADSVRVFETHSGSCVGRWASSGPAERVAALEWALLPSSQASDEKTAHRGRKRRKGVNGENDDGQGDADAAEGHAAGTSAAATSESAEASLVEVLALGLKSNAILILHPTQSTIIQTLAHSSVTAPAVSLSFPSTTSHPALKAPSYLWSCTATGQLSVWSLPRLSGTKGKLVAQYNTQCASCSQIAVRYVPGKAQVNGTSELEASSATTSTITVQVLVGQFSIKLLEVPLPSIKQGSSDAFERPRIHTRSECSGHASEVSQLLWLSRDLSQSTPSTSTSPQPHFISIAKGDRFVSLWSSPTVPTAEGPATGLLVATLGLDEEPRRIALAPGNDLMCTVSSDAARLISLEQAFASPSSQNQTSDQSAGKNRRRKHSDLRSLKILSTITSSQPSVPCTDAYLSSSPANTVYISAGVLKPALDILTYRDDTGSYYPTLEITAKPQGALSGMNGHTGAEAPRAAYSESRQSTVLSAEAARDPSVAMAQLSAQPIDPAAEPTIAERLKDLNVKEHQREVTVDDPSKRKGRRAGGRNAAGKNRVTDALSTSQSLVQALHSADVRLLETCLAEKNGKVIRATVRRVPSTLVLPLVEALVERLSRTRKGTGEGAGGVDSSRGQVLIEWLRNVLVVHLGYLITLPSLVERLSALHATLESRMSSHSQLLALSGRLDLVVSQIDVRANPIQDVIVSQKVIPARSYKPNAVPAKKYVEGDESDSSTSSEEEGDEGADADVPMAVEPAEEGDEEDIEDLVMANGDLSEDELENDDEDDGNDDENEEDDLPALRKSKSKEKPRMNGFLDIEAEESENDGSDEDGAPVKPRSSGVKLNGVIHEDSLDEDEEDDLDRYESDFINDDSEEEEEAESGEDGEDDDDEE